MYERQRLMEGINSYVGELSSRQQVAIGSLSRGEANALIKSWERFENLEDLDRWLETNLVDMRGQPTSPDHE